LVVLSLEAFCRGLIIDKSAGNIIKVDRHKYVRKVCHGKQELNSAEKKAVYGSHVLSFTESNYVNIDTLFLLIDALLFTSLVDLADKNPGLINKSYEDIYKDVRASVDLCHRDGVIKDAVIKDPAKHIIYDTGMVPMLQQLKQAGKKVGERVCVIYESGFVPYRSGNRTASLLNSYDDKF
jgi:5' nucleotidase family